MAGAVVEGSDDLYVPTGIDEVPREGGAAREAPAKATQKASFGITDLEVVKGSARQTLRGLLAFQWTMLFLTLSCYLALGATACVGLAGSGVLGSAGGAASVAGWVVGSIAFALFAAAAYYGARGLRASHLGRNELGVLQRREVEAGERLVWRGVYALSGGLAVAWAFGMQEATPARLANIPSATLIALVAGLAGGLLASVYFSAFFTRYLRNLSPKSSKKDRRRFRMLFVVAGTLPIAIAIAGTPLVVLDNDYGCSYQPETCGGELLTLASPSFGPAYHLRAHLVGDTGFSPEEALVFVVAGLAVSRVFAVLGLRSYRKQLRAAELLLRQRIRESAPPAVSTA